MKLEDDYVTDGNKGTSTCPAYTIEARTMGLDPMQRGDQIFTDKWKRVHFEESIIGVPTSQSKEVVEHGMLDYAAAQALRWWFHAGSHRFSPLETRLVRHLITTTHEIKALSCHDIIGGEDMSHQSPDHKINE